MSEIKKFGQENEMTKKAGLKLKVDEIVSHAGSIHSDVNQRYGTEPYVTHLKMVIDCVLMEKRHIKDEDYLAVIFGAAFHDTIEDARLTYNDVLKIARHHLEDEEKAVMATEIVYALTNEKGRNREERANAKYYEGIRNTKYAPLVKMADRLANMQFSVGENGNGRMVKCYQKEAKQFLVHVGASNTVKYNRIATEILQIAKED